MLESSKPPPPWMESDKLLLLSLECLCWLIAPEVFRWPLSMLCWMKASCYCTVRSISLFMVVNLVLLLPFRVPVANGPSLIFRLWPWLVCINLDPVAFLTLGFLSKIYWLGVLGFRLNRLSFYHLLNASEAFPLLLPLSTLFPCVRLTVDSDFVIAYILFECDEKWPYGDTVRLLSWFYVPGACFPPVSSGRSSIFIPIDYFSLP